jgi:hypothetical protein
MMPHEGASALRNKLACGVLLYSIEEWDEKAIDRRNKSQERSSPSGLKS